MVAPFPRQQVARMSISVLQPRTEPVTFAPLPEIPGTPLRRRLIIGDAIAGLAAFVVPSALPGHRLAGLLASPSVAEVAVAGLVCVAVVGIVLLTLAAERLYLSRVSSVRSVEIARITRASFVFAVTAVVGGRLVGEAHMVNYPIAVGVCAFIFLNLWRTSFATWLKSARRNGRFLRSVMLIGANDDAENLYRLLNTHPELGYRIVGVIGKEADLEANDFGSIPRLGDINNLHTALQSGVKGALVAGSALSRRQLNSVIRTLLENNVHVQMSTGINGIDHRRMRNLSLAYEPMVYVERSDLEGWQLAIKRAIDVVISATVLVLASPLLGISALAVKLYDGGPVFFHQERVGRHGKTFRMIKLRSMCLDAESRLLDLREQNLREGPLFKVAMDPRVTPVGRIIRATSIDELPQLLNVLKGDMSLVGPRPALPSEVEDFDDALLARHNVLPGITGLWQVEGRDSPDFSLYQRFDIFYVENWSVALDLSILGSTAKVVVIRAFQALGRFRTKQSNSPDLAAERYLID